MINTHSELKVLCFDTPVSNGFLSVTPEAAPSWCIPPGMQPILPAEAGKSSCLVGVGDPLPSDTDGERRLRGIASMVDADEWIILPAPIDDIRRITTQLYAGEIPLAEVSQHIADMCATKWKAAAATFPSRSIAVEHLPPPFHTWIFDPAHDFNTAFSDQVQSHLCEWDTADYKEREEIRQKYLSRNHILDALSAHDELRSLDTVVAIAIPRWRYCWRMWRNGEGRRKRD